MVRYGRTSRYGASGNTFRTRSSLSRSLSSSPALPDFTSRIDPHDPSFGGSPAYPSPDNINPASPITGGQGGGVIQPGPTPPQPATLPGPAPSGGGNGGGNNGNGNGNNGLPPGFNPYGLDYSGDPILQQIRALNQANVQAAHAAELSRRKQALIGFGHIAGTAADPTVWGDADTVTAAEQNPFSTLAQLLHNDDLRRGHLDDALNRGNLYYGSTRGTKLGEDQRQYLSEQAAANNQLAGLLSGFNQDVLGAEQGAQQSNMNAEQGAYQRALDFALQYGISPTGVPGQPGAPGNPEVGDTPVGTHPAGMRLRVNNGASVNANDPSALDTSGGWGVRWEGPGVYEAWKSDPNAQGHSDTVWVKVGDFPSAAPTGAPGAGVPGAQAPPSPGQVAPPPPATAPPVAAAPGAPPTLADLLKPPRFRSV